MNMQQLQYLAEIERTCSISQAAANLYIGQPNLSRVLRDVEESVGFRIFERTRRGVKPTEKGQAFLQHARNILRELEFMENLGPNCTQPGRFRICLPRSYSLFEKTEDYLKSLPAQDGLDAAILECHPKRALEVIGSGSAEIAIIRYRMEYQDYFAEQVSKLGLTMRQLEMTRYCVVVSRHSPLAGARRLDKSDLKGYTEIVHSDLFMPAGRQDGGKRIYTVDRMAQVQLLRNNTDMYLWSEPLPEAMLCDYALVQIPCDGGGYVYRNELIYRSQYAMSEIEQNFIRLLLNGRE